MIAVRMCVTGHCQSEIESTVRQCAPATGYQNTGTGGKASQLG